jgi:hypothetical protein
MKKLFRFQYFTTDNFPFLHQVRDLAIFVELSAILFKKGYLYEDSFLNYPKMEDNQSGILSFGKNDLMLLTTRPPLSDGPQNKRKIYRTNHIYEKKMLEQIGSCFISLSRNVMFLKKKVAKNLRKDFEDRASIDFYVNQNKSNKSAGYKAISGHDERGVERNWKKWSKISKTQKSCAFIILFKSDGVLPKMLHVFGMGGEEGLIFSRILRNGLWDKLAIDFNGSSRLIMVEFDIHIPETFPTNLNSVKDLHYDVILDMKLS